MDSIHLLDIEAAIDHWRTLQPSPDGLELAPAARSLADSYARMLWAQQTWLPVQQMTPDAYQAWLAWYATTADTPCIAICSTSQGDAVCKGCGRTFEEIREWPGLSPASKRRVWHRITTEGDAWRFNRYAERAAGADRPAAPETMPTSDQAGMV